MYEDFDTFKYLERMLRKRLDAPIVKNYFIVVSKMVALIETYKVLKTL
jgi:hypothetical protein